MRIREVQTERYLMDAFGLFYELPSMVYGGRVWGVRPVASRAASRSACLDATRIPFVELRRWTRILPMTIVSLARRIGA